MKKSRREDRPAPKQRPRPREATPTQDARAVRRLGRREWIVLCGILLVGLVLRMAYLSELAGSPAFRYPAFDAAFHDYWARCLVTGDWSAPKFHPDPHIHETAFFRPPGYPYFLAGVYLTTGKSYFAARVVQMLFGLANCLLAFVLARKIFGRRVGLILAALMACYWVFIYFEGEFLAPVLEVFLALSMLIVLVRWPDRTTYKNTLLAGLLVGVFALVRPNALVLVPVALVWIWWVARRRKDSARLRVALVGFPLGVALAIAPATIRNYVVARDWVPITSNGGINLYIGNNEYTDCVSANVPILGEMSTLGSWTCFDEPAISAAVEKMEGRRLKSSEVSKFFTSKALSYIAGHPGRTAALGIKKTLYFWGPAEISNNKVDYYERTHSRVLRFLPGFPLALALFVVGLLLLLVEFRGGRKAASKFAESTPRRIELTVLLLAFVVAYFASHLPFFVVGRYRVPVIPVLLLFGAYGIERVRAMVAARDLKHAAVWIGVFVVAYLGATRQLAPYRPDLGVWHFDRGDAYRKQGKTELALAEFQQAVELSEKPNPVALNNLGVALDQTGRREEAVKRFEQALAANSNFLDARRNLVAVLLRMDQPAAATEHLLEIVRLDPNDASARFNLGVCLLRQSKTEEAIRYLMEAVRLNPNHFYTQYYLAKALSLIGRQKEALPHYREAVRINGNNVDALYEFAALLAESGDNQQAIVHLERVLALKPDYPGARGLLEKLESK
jgi:tetratricopeptide (TPR) repeat protein